MTSTPAFYLEQAANCARSAASAGLANQRETFLRAEAVWQEMADRSLRTIEARREREEASRDSASGGFPDKTEDQPR
jgi:hypothetical protein